MPLPEEFSANKQNPKILKENLIGFEKLLADDRNTKIVWSHVGGEEHDNRTVELCRQLLKSHSNLYMSIRVNRRGPKPTLAMTPTNILKPAWKNLFEEFSDRFVFGSDSFYTSTPDARRGGKPDQFDAFQDLLAQVSKSSAEKIAKNNALSIYPRIKNKID